MKRALFAFAAAVLLLSPGRAVSATIEFREIAFNVGGIVYDSLGPPVVDPGAPGLNDSGFDYNTGLGSLIFSLSAGSSIFAFVDFDIYDGASDTFFDDSASQLGAVPVGGSWEIDEPGFVFGDIFTNLTAGALDNTVFDGVITNEDVSMAIGRSVAQDAVVTFALTLNDPGGFRLRQTSASGDEIFFSSTVRLVGDPAPIPEPGTLALFGAGALIGAFKLRGRFAKSLKK
jgi:hypothetical protein